MATDERTSTPYGTFHVRHALPTAEASGAVPVVLVHGLGLSHHLWDDAVHRLSSLGHETFALDILGHGRSDDPATFFTIEDHARSIVAFLDARAVSEAIVVGNSMGTLIAVSAAAQFPERIRGSVIFGCPAWGSAAERTRWLRTRTDRIDLGTGAPTARASLGEGPVARALDADRDLIGLWLLHSLWAIASYDLMSVLAMVRSPVHVAYGDGDGLRETGRNLAALELVTTSQVEGAGHQAPLDRPELVAETIDGFVKACTP